MIVKKKKIKAIKLVICGSVDDGKSTLIGRLLFETNNIYKDQIKALSKDTKKYSSTKKEFDYSLIMDGLLSEREQGITIDVAFKYFDYKNTRFTICDSPGHEEYTRNMASAASICNSAILLIDAKKGITKQTKRHLYLLSIFNVENLAIVINKMDLFNYSEKVFLKIQNKLDKLLKKTNFKYLELIPSSAIENINIVKKSKKVSWYKGACLVKFLNNLREYKKTNNQFIMPVQYVLRNNKNQRYYSGKVTNGNLKKNDEITIYPSMEKNKIKEIYSGNIKINNTLYNKSISFTTTKETDLSRGSFIAKEDNNIFSSSSLLVKLIVIDTENLYLGRIYSFYRAGLLCDLKIDKIVRKFDFNNFSYTKANTIEKNNIIEVEVSLTENFFHTQYIHNKNLGSFVIIDKITKKIVSAGIILSTLKTNNITKKVKTLVTKKERAKIKNQMPFVLWFTGISGAGKTTIANLVESTLYEANKHTYILDGDNLRVGINKDLGFRAQDRIENIRRTAEIAKLFIDSGIITIVALISPFKAERNEARKSFNNKQFFEIFIDTPIEIAAKRDPKKLYKKANLGKINHMTGITSPYEKPTNPFITIKTEKTSAKEAAIYIIKKLKEVNVL